MEMPATDGYGKAGSLEPGQDTKGQQSQTVTTVRYPDKSESLGKYETRTESSSETPLDKMELELRHRICYKG